MEKDFREEDLLIVCRETNRTTGECIVYEVGFLDKDNILIRPLRIRQRYNPELEYYAILESELLNKDYIFTLIKKKVKSVLYTYV